VKNHIEYVEELTNALKIGLSGKKYLNKLSDKCIELAIKHGVGPFLASISLKTTKE
jgi:hypothetical protein